MKIIIGIPALGQYPTLKDTINLIKENAGEKVEIVVFDNGSTPKIPQNNFNYKLIKSPTNIGVPKAMNAIMDKYEADFYFFIHSDVQIFEKNFIQTTREAIEQAENQGRVGVVGGFGSLQLGANDIYRTPYEKSQLARAYNIQGSKNNLGTEHGGKVFTELFKRCITLDGYMLIVRKGLRFWENAPHHMYDHDICMESIKQGYQNLTINLDHNHIGGVSVCREDWATPFKKTPDEIHDLAHTEFYEKWRGFLPALFKNEIFYY